MNRTRIGLISAAVFALFLVMGWATGRVLGLDGSDLLILRAVIWLLGAVAAVLLYFYLLARHRRTAGPAGAAAGDDIDVVIAAAEDRLRSAPIAGAKKLRKLPLALVLGPTGSAKTSTVANSGTEPELLAGDADRAGTGVPTSTVNVWYTREMIVAEAGGPVVEDETRWARLVKRLRPLRFAAAFGRSGQAPRVAVVCFPCDEFLKPGNSEAVPAAATRLRERLAEASRQLGMRLPVYVVFTKTDRLPYFEDFVRNLSREEAQEVLGATLPAVTNPDVGSYAERETTRVRDAFAGIYRSLSLRRLDVLPREPREEIRTGAYEFPRELRKISELATAFLVELCRPRQLGGGPFLRGFYFTGVRPVIVSDVARDRQAPTAPGPQVALGATVVFNPMAAAAQASTPAPAAGGRKVPEWTFLGRVFREVVFRDRNAMALTAGGARVNLLRRLALGLATGIAVVLVTGFTVSFLGNRELVTAAFGAARATEGIAPTGGDPPSAEALARLDELRERTELLRRYQVEGRPTRLGWGLYAGSAVLPELRAIYFDRFATLLWGDTRSQVLASLRGLPDSPEASAEYGEVYDLLKAHLITTSHPAESTPDFLAPVLLRQWAAVALPDEERRELARRQFAFFGAELPFGNPYADQPEEATVARTRILLQQFSNADQFYQVMISEASRDHPAIRFDETFPGAGSVVTNTFEVPGAFTKEGWEAVQASLENVDRLFAREDWVVGERAVSAEDRVRLAQELRSRYVADYVSHWRDYLRAGTVARGSGVAATSQALARLSGNESPILQMLALAARNTAVDSGSVASAFQPVHAVTPPDVTDRFISDANAPYIAALANLQSALEQVATASGSARDAAMTLAVSGADRVRSEVRALAQDFSIEGEASIVGTTVQNLLQAPVAGTESLLGALPSAEINQAGAAFCTPFRQLSSRFPFNPSASAEASIDEVNAVFQRGSSALWAFHDDVLQGLLARQGSRFAARVGASPQPTAEFVAFFNRAAEFSEAMYDERGAGPAIGFLLRAQTSDALPEITINIDGQAQTFTRTFAAARPYTWQGDRAQFIRISANIGGRDETLLEGSGTWGIFRLFQTAEWESLGGDRYMLRWPITGRSETLAAELTMNSGTPPVFRRGYFDQFTCVSRIVQ